MQLNFLWTGNREALYFATGRRVSGGMSGTDAPFDEKRQNALLIVFQIQGFPLKHATIGTLSRTGSRTLELNAAAAEVSGELVNVARMRGPAYESRLGQLSQITYVRCSGLLGVRRDDFEVVPFTE